MLLGANELTEEQRLQKAVLAIAKEAPMLAGVMMIGKKTVMDTIPGPMQTAATDGKNEMYARPFVRELSDREFRGVIVHEVYHKLFSHLVTWKHLWGIDPECANKACDHVINLKILDEFDSSFLSLPEGGCYDPKYKGWDAAKVFKDLYDQKKKGGGGGGGDGESFDNHDWEQAQSMTPQEQKELASEIDRALRQGALASDKMGKGGLRNLEELMKVQVDWKEVLREFVTSTCKGSDYSTWSRPNRRYIGYNMYMPSGISESVGELVIAIDTSGSIGQRELTCMLSEVKGIVEIVKPEAIRLLYWGSNVCGDEVYGGQQGAPIDQLVSSTKPVDGGGTRVEQVPLYMQDKGINPQAAIIITDGHLGGSWGSWTCPTLWCFVDNDSANSPIGKSVYVDAGAL